MQDRARLENELRRAQQELAEGRSLISSGAGDVNVAKQREITITTRIALIYQKLYELAPDDYPIEDITPNTQTKLSFA